MVPPLPPGCLSTVWGDDERFVNTYFKDFKGQLIYSTFDWGIRDKDGYYFILGRTDDVINVAGHRLGTKELESACLTVSSIAEAAVVGHPLGGEQAAVDALPERAIHLAYLPGFDLFLSGCPYFMQISICMCA